jgi:hypothetical protein
LHERRADVVRIAAADTYSHLLFTHSTKLNENQIQNNEEREPGVMLIVVAPLAVNLAVSSVYVGAIVRAHTKRWVIETNGAKCDTLPVNKCPKSRSQCTYSRKVFKQNRRCICFPQSEIRTRQWRRMCQARQRSTAARPAHTSHRASALIRWCLFVRVLFLLALLRFI